MRRFLLSYGLFAGGVIGVGVFALPATLVASGLLSFLAHLAVVSLIVWWIHRWYLAVVVSTRERHRLPGYARLYLGAPAYFLTAAANLLGFVGALVAYLVAGGTFLRLLLAPFAPLSDALAVGLYLLPGALLLLWGLRALPSFELVILVLFLLVLFVLPLIAGDRVALARVPLAGARDAAFLPYGVLLFALWGLSLVPETAELAGRNERRALRVLSVGLATAVIAYVLFAALVAGITGASTTEDALQGLQTTLGDGVVALALVFGILTTFSSYLALGLTLLRTLMLDLRVPRFAAWAATIFVPLVLVLKGAPSLLLVLGLTGAVFLGIEGLVVLALRAKLLRERGERGRAPRWGLPVALAGVGALLVVGVVGELVRHLVS